MQWKENSEVLGSQERYDMSNFEKEAAYACHGENDASMCEDESTLLSALNLWGQNLKPTQPSCDKPKTNKYPRALKAYIHYKCRMNLKWTDFRLLGISPQRLRS